MSWYKKAQQNLLFYPHLSNPGSVSERIQPISIEKETGERIYSCSLCKQPVLEGDIEEWYTQKEEEKGATYNLPPYDRNKISQALQEIVQYLLPFYNKLETYIQEENLESKKNDTYDYNFTSSLYRWEVQVPQLPYLLNKHQSLIDLCSYKSSSYSNSVVCSLFQVGTEISGKTLYDLTDFLSNPEKEVDNFMQFSGEQYEISYEVPVCPECGEKLDKCTMCSNPIFPGELKTETSWDSTEFACENCLENGTVELCIDCGKAEVQEDTYYVEHRGGYVCEKCYKGGSKDVEVWAEDKISNLDIPIGKNLPLSSKVLNSLDTFLERYLNKYGNNYLDYKEWGRLNHIGKKSGLPVGAIEYLNSIGESYNPKKDSYSHREVIDIYHGVEDNLDAQNYMKEKYPNLSSYKDLPFDIEVLPNYDTEKQGFTIGITPSHKFFDYAIKKYPNIQDVWDRMSQTPHHDGTLAYARCAYEMGDSLVINNLQRDADYDNFIAKTFRDVSPEDKEAAKWLDTTTKNWDAFLLDVIKSIAISEDISAYLTTFDHQKKKWSNLPIHKSKKTYKETPERMGFEITDPQDAGDLAEKGGYPNQDMYQLANDTGMNWYKKAQIKDNPYYTDIGHDYESGEHIIWISDLSGNNFYKADSLDYDHYGLAYDAGLNQQTGTIQGRYDTDKNIVSIVTNPFIATMRELPELLINRLYREFGSNIKIIDYSRKTPEIVI